MAGLKRPIGNPDGTNDAAGGSSAFEIIWNPDRWPWDIDDFRSIQKAIEAGGAPVANWSTGARKQGIEPGDRIFLFLVGQKSRGLLASGRAANGIDILSHWDGTRNGEAPYVDVEWDTLLDPSDVLPWSEIMSEVPGFPDRFQSGGQSISIALMPALEELWQKHIDGVASAPIVGKATPGIEAEYSDDVVKRRKHQAEFRKLLFAHYPHKCFVCGFDQKKILEAAHIIPDSKGGSSDVENGRLMCPNHHRAHDAGLFRLKGDKPVWHDASTEFLEPLKPRHLTAK